MSADTPVRLDKWLWAARFFKTRSLATAAVTAGDVRIDDQRVKAARSVRPGDRLQIRRGEDRVELVIVELSNVRGAAPVAQRLYQETDESQRRRVLAIAQRALAREPSVDLRGRPTKRDARTLRRLRDSR